MIIFVHFYFPFSVHCYIIIYKIISKNKKQKYYAIKEGKGVKNKIVRTWSECKELVLGYPSIYKSFYTEEDLQQKQ